MSDTPTSYPNRTFIGEYLGFKLPYQGPANTADFDKLLGDGSAIETCMKAYDYQIRGPLFRDELATRLEKLSGQERKKTYKKNKAGEDVVDTVETEAKFLNRLRSGVYDGEGETAALVYQLSDADAHRIAEEINKDLGDWDVALYTAGATIAAKYLAYADKVLGKIAAGIYTEDHVVNTLASQTGQDFATVYGKPTRENIARAYKYAEEKAERERQSAL